MKPDAPQRASRTGAECVRLPYRDAVLDVAFLVAVLGEVPNPAACTTSAARMLRPGALLSVTEIPGDPDALALGEVEVVGF